jgi:hypothetical protein
MAAGEMAAGEMAAMETVTGPATPSHRPRYSLLWMTWPTVCFFGSGKSRSITMVRTGRPTRDPKGERITIRVALRDREVLQTIAERDRVSLAEAARRVMREALGIPPVLPKTNNRGRNS